VDDPAQERACLGADADELRALEARASDSSGETPTITSIAGIALELPAAKPAAPVAGEAGDQERASTRAQARAAACAQHVVELLLDARRGTSSADGLHEPVILPRCVGPTGSVAIGSRKRMRNFAGR